jgi:hypothetical protein
MTNKIEATHDGQVIYTDEAFKLEPYTTRVQVRAVKMKLALRKKKAVLTMEVSQKPQEYTDLPERLDHYLFW